MASWNLPDLIDHTVLRPDATRADVLRACQDAVEYHFTVIFVPPAYLPEAVAAVYGTSIRVGIPIGFPLGSHTTTAKVAEAVEGAERGATIVDMVLNIGWLKSGDYARVQEDIAEVIRATPSIEHKVILETCYLTEQEKRIACQLALDAGADYVKTSTGFGPTGATVDDVRLLKEIVAGRARIKASGGIRDWRTALALLEAGADRIGTSTGVAIVQEWRAWCQG
ncbi:MAG: deoxyribose-phosphate aldolase [Nitrospira sp.]|nr:deoxyribose-phosphate aldolase [Nitrospira sp.]